MPIDFKKENKDLYQPKTTPAVINVPEMVFIMVDGAGNPNTSEEYKTAVEILYGLSYAIKMGNKEILEYVVPPLEGLWWLADGEEEWYKDKGKYCWTSMIRQPGFVTEDVFEAAKTALAKKKPQLDTKKARLIKFTEGLCVQAMHIGPYDDEPRTNAAIIQFINDNGYLSDINDKRSHHEIYLGDPRKTAPEKLKTIIRNPVAGVMVMAQKSN
ncbi:MAG: GyrI-like domain-containing protein [Lachnospiraceae bacterium]|nr:GyrI-like domain-containing protein [Lachnospiraceae bacterium]